MTKPKKIDKVLSEKDKIKQLEEENLYLKAENEYLKKLRALVQERESNIGVKKSGFKY